MNPLSPFSGPKYHDHAGCCSLEETPCGLCGRGVKEPWPFAVRVVEGGSRFATEDEFYDRVPVDPCSDMGGWPVGSDCARKLRKAGVFVETGNRK